MRPKKRASGNALIAGLCVLSAASSVEAEEEKLTVELPSVKVISTRPLPDLGTPIERVPSNVQAATASGLREHQSLSLPDFMAQSLSGITVNESQNNPFQPDVNFRGFTASPLLGTPQGLSVFVDGVRVNEPFGDTVNWDLIPFSAISGMSLVPGSNPLFGLNTLGGAVSIQTKTGAQYPGLSAQAYGGSWGRRAAEIEYGGKHGNLDYFVTGNLFREDGWRDYSPSRVRQLFGKIGWEDGKTDFDLSYTFADNDLTGNGFTPRSLIDDRRESAYTYPDNTRNRLNFINGRGSHWLSPDLLLAANAYYRENRVRTFNGDVNDEYADSYGELVGAGGECESAPDPAECAAEHLQHVTGVNNRTTTRQRGYGFAAQLTSISRFDQNENQLVAGVSLDLGRSRFEQSEQAATLTASRGTEATDIESQVTSLSGLSRTWGIYASNTWSWRDKLHLTLSGRYVHTRVELVDRIGTELNGNHTFNRFNPAAGLTFTPSSLLTLFAGYSEGSRAPSPIELGCADPAVPCKLPNAMAADPPLKQVVAKTFEVGARGVLGSLNWSSALYRTENHDDIQFISSSTSGAGYFNNVGKTRRQGAELGIGDDRGRLHWNLSYSYVDATYRSPISVLGANNSTADADGFIAVSPGSRIPGIPRHSVKLVASIAVTEAWQIGTSIAGYSSQFARGNENNRHEPGENAAGETFLGSGRIPGYAVVNIDTRFRFVPGWELFAKINNVFDRDYSTAGILGQNPFAGGRFAANPDSWLRETAYAPGAPRAGWIGVRATFK